MQTAKQDALNTIQKLPDNADMEEMIYRLYVLENIRSGRQDANEGNTQTIPNPQIESHLCSKGL
ncbi:hypothetical protein [Thiolapillus sp.]